MIVSRSEQDYINRVAWRACETFRGVIDAVEYKNYVLVMLFLKYLSDVWKDTRGNYREERFVLPPNSSFDFLFEWRDEPDIGELINLALRNIEEENRPKLDGVFRSVDFTSPNLGETRDRNRRLRHLLEVFGDPILELRTSRIRDPNIIANTYEYLISRFANHSGGEFYTPYQVSILLAKLLQPKSGSRICDPICGSGSLLISMANEVGDRNLELYGQEPNGSIWALCRMNMFLHGKDDARIELGDVLNNPKLIKGGSLMKFDVVVANPPFSLDKWGAENAEMDEFRRFCRGVPPKNNANYAFISHMIETLVEPNGKAGVIVPHGALFRRGAEGSIRRNLIEDNLLEAVIGLPANLFFGIGIPTAIMVFNRGKKTKDVLFIDASNDYDHAKNQNKLRDGAIATIIETFKNFQSVEKYAYRATLQEIKENGFSLSISRYVKRFEDEEPVDLKQVQDEIDKLEKELGRVRLELSRQLSDLDS